MKTKNTEKKRVRGTKMHKYKLEDKRHTPHIHLFSIMRFAICFMLLFASIGVVSAAPDITSWSNTKTGDSDIMFLVTQGETITFNVSPSGTYEWQLNKVIQSATGDSFTWTVPNEKDIWEIHVTDGSDHIEWVVSTLSIDEAPDIFDYFADGKVNSRTDTDPWGRALLEWGGEYPPNASDGFANSDEGAVDSVVSSSIAYGTWKFKYRFPKADEERVYKCLCFYPIMDSGASQSFKFVKCADAHAHNAIEHGGHHPYSIEYDAGIFPNKEWIDITIIRSEDGWYYVYRGDILSYHAHEDAITVSNSMRLEMSSGATIHFDNLEVYEDKYLFPEKEIVFAEWIANYYNVGPATPTKREGGIIVVTGRGIGLSNINNAINNPSLFTYNLDTKTAICYTDLVIFDGTEFVMENETLKFHCNYDGELQFAPKYGSTIRIQNSTITTDTEHYFTWNNAGSTTHYGWSAAIYSEFGTYYSCAPGKGDLDNNPVGTRSLMPDLPFGCYARFIIENSVINNVAHMFFDSPKELVITNTEITNLHEIDIGNYAGIRPDGWYTERARWFTKGDKSFWVMIDDMNIYDLNLKGITFNGKDITPDLTFSTNALRDKTNIYDIDAENANVVVKKSQAQNPYQSHSWSPYGPPGTCGDIDSELGLVNCRFANLIIATDKARGIPKYYLDIKVVDSDGYPISGATIAVTNEVNTDYSPENLQVEHPYAADYYANYYHHYRLVIGQSLSSTTTGVNGHSPLPADTENALVIADNVKDAGGLQNFTYTITASKNGQTASMSGLDIDETWYREDPNTPVKTVVCNIDTGECWVEGVVTGTISGIIKDKDIDAPIEGATVTDGTRFAITNESGGYALSNVPEGTYTVKASAKGYENSSDTAIVTADNTTTVNFELNPVGEIFLPITNVTITPTPNEAGWNNVTPVLVTFFRNDTGGSGVSYTNYSRTSQTGPWTTVNATTATGFDAGNVTNISEGKFNVTVSGEGTMEIWYYSVDNNSNVEATKKVTVKIDTTAPAPETIPPIVTTPNATPSLIPDDTDNDPRWGETAQLNVTITDDSDILSVTINLSQIGGSSVQPMTNIGGNIWSVTTNASAGTAGWSGTAYEPYCLQVNATDKYGNSNTSVCIELMVMKNGDVTGDGIVDFGKGIRLINHDFYPEDPMYSLPSDTIADVTGDGIVDFGDGIRLINHDNYPEDPSYILK